VIGAEKTLEMQAEDTPPQTSGIAILGPLTVLLGSVLLLTVAWRPLDSLVGVTADDMYYYLEIARNLAQGRGATFDGVTPTNGWHPLWMTILVGLNVISGGASDLTVHLALSVVVLATAATGLLLWKLVDRAVGPWGALVATALWMFHPWTGAISLSGVEAPLATLALVTSLYLSRDANSNRGAWLLGFAMGLACLARTDSVLLCAVLGLATYGAALVRSPGATSKLMARCVAAGTITLAPWWIWNLLNFGRISQDSARAIMMMNRGDWFQTHSLSELWPLVPGKLMVWFDGLGRVAGLPGWLIVVFALVAIAAAVVLARRGSDPLLPVVIGTSLLAIGAFYSLVFWYQQKWYMLSSLMLLACLAGLAAGPLLSSLRRRMPKVPDLALGGLVLVLLAALCLPASSRLSKRGVYPWQRIYHLIATNLDQLPPGSKVGAFNSGIYGYFGAPTVVNLDGGVNGEVLEAMKAGRLLAYVRAEGITHIVDHEYVFVNFGRYAEPDWTQSLTPLSQFPNELGGGNLTLVAVDVPSS